MILYDIAILRFITPKLISKSLFLLDFDNYTNILLLTHHYFPATIKTEETSGKVSANFVYCTLFL
jgi:hypothetical protein